MGLYYYTLGQLEEVEAALLKALIGSTRPTPITWCSWRLFYEKMERFDEALEMASKLVRLEPANQMFQQMLLAIREKADAEN